MKITTENIDLNVVVDNVYDFVAAEYGVLKGQESTLRDKVKTTTLEVLAYENFDVNEAVAFYIKTVIKIQIDEELEEGDNRD